MEFFLIDVSNTSGLMLLTEIQRSVDSTPKIINYSEKKTFIKGAIEVTDWVFDKLEFAKMKCL